MNDLHEQVNSEMWSWILNLIQMNVMNASQGQVAYEVRSKVMREGYNPLYDQVNVLVRGPVYTKIREDFDNELFA